MFQDPIKHEKTCGSTSWRRKKAEMAVRCRNCGKQSSKEMNRKVTWKVPHKIHKWWMWRMWKGTQKEEVTRVLASGHHSCVVWKLRQEFKSRGPHAKPSYEIWTNCKLCQRIRKNPHSMKRHIRGVHQCRIVGKDSKWSEGTWNGVPCTDCSNKSNRKKLI